MNIRELVQFSLLLGVGVILHLVVPGYAMGMKPDLFLSMLIIIIFLNRNFKVSIVAGAVAGLLCALTTQFPAGQIPNIVDKIISSVVIYALAKALYGRMANIIAVGIVGAIGTLVSGSIFLLVALALSGIPAPFGVLFVTAILPATALNTVGIVVLYPIVNMSKQMVQKSRPKEVTK